jgi:hypothetical protein
MSEQRATDEAVLKEAIKLYIDSELSGRIRKEVADQIDLSWRPVGRIANIAIPVISTIISVLPALAWSAAVVLASFAGVTLYYNIRYSYLQADIENLARNTAKSAIEERINDMESNYANITGRIENEMGSLSDIVDDYRRRHSEFDDVIAQSGILKANSNDLESKLDILKHYIDLGHLGRAADRIERSSDKIAEIVVEKYIDKNTVMGWVVPEGFVYVSLGGKCLESFDPGTMISVKIDSLKVKSGSFDITDLQKIDNFVENGILNLTLCVK